MKNEYSYGMRQMHKLVMTKEMQISIKVLQMSSTELSEYVEKEFVDNPVIEIDNNMSTSTNEYDYSIYNKKRSDSSDVSPLNFIFKEKSLNDYLHEQILEVEKDKVIRKTADYIIECLDENGYFKVPKEIVVENLNVSLEIVKRALKLVQSLEPSGIGAEDLKACLLIQLKKINIEKKEVIELIENNLQDIGDDNYKKIAEDLNISRQEAQSYCELIRKLEPRPSRGFYTGEDYRYIVPDAEVIKVEDRLEILMNGRAVPPLIISSTYKNILNEKSDSETVEYVKEKLCQAEFLIKSIEQRKVTLKSILEWIVKKQYEYFMGREKFLKPMMIKEAAEELKFSESTVSRAIKDKYILTFSGIIKVKDLFSINAIKNCENNISASSIKNSIKKIIKDEDKKKPAPDQEIVEKLKNKGIEISRRTVAKYREELGIKSSHKRRVL